MAVIVIKRSNERMNLNVHAYVVGDMDWFLNQLDAAERLNSGGAETQSTSLIVVNPLWNGLIYSGFRRRRSGAFNKRAGGCTL